MVDNVQLAKQFFSACMKKDFDTVKTLLHPKYTLKDPMMTCNSPDELIEMIKNCPSECTLENTTFISDSDKVVVTFDSVMTEPVNARMRMCDILVFENGKVKSEEMFYDSAKIPQELKTMMSNSSSGNSKKKVA